MINAGRSCEVGAFDICRGISDAVALRPLLVSFDTRKGACQGCTAGTAILVGLDVTINAAGSAIKAGQ